MDESFWKNWDIFNTILHILGERKRKWMTPTRRRWSQVGKGAGGAAASPTSAAKKDVASNEEKRETACQVYCTLYTRRWRIKNMIAHTCSSPPSQSPPLPIRWLQSGRRASKDEATTKLFFFGSHGHSTSCESMRDGLVARERRDRVRCRLLGSWSLHVNPSSSPYFQVVCAAPLSLYEWACVCGWVVFANG